MTNITLAIDEKILAKARSLAKSRGTTLNALVRAELARLITQDEREEEARAGLLKLIDNSTGRLGPGFKFNREELYESTLFPGHQRPPLRRGR